MNDRIELLVTVKACPALSQTYGEVVCVAGVRTDTPSPEWVRLYPIKFRELAFAQRFKKYQRISIEATPHSGDPRPETMRPNVESLQLIGDVVPSTKGWTKRRPYVDPLVMESMCEIRRRHELDGTSLGAFRPDEVLELVVDTEADEWEKDQAGIAAQPSLFFPTNDGLEKIPFRFRYRYRCSTPGCRTHCQSMIDWELAQSFRAWRERYDEATLLDKLRQRFLNEMCGPRKDTVFFVGNQHRYPKGFLVLGVFWPPSAG